MFLFGCHAFSFHIFSYIYIYIYMLRLLYMKAFVIRMRRIGRWREVRLDRSTAPASTEPQGGSQGPGGSPQCRAPKGGHTRGIARDRARLSLITCSSLLQVPCLCPHYFLKARFLDTRKVVFQVHVVDLYQIPPFGEWLH